MGTTLKPDEVGGWDTSTNMALLRIALSLS
jgi:hypothetical protein